MAARDSPVGPEPLSPDAIRIGTSANLLFAIVALITNIGLPLLVETSTKDYDTWLARRFPSRLLSSLINYSRLGIPRTWTCAHILYALTMFSTFFVTSQAGATALIGVAGLAWALMLWAPYAIIGAEIATRQQSVRVGVYTIMFGASFFFGGSAAHPETCRISCMHCYHCDTRTQTASLLNGWPRGFSALPVLQIRLNREGRDNLVYLEPVALR